MSLVCDEISDYKEGLRRRTDGGISSSYPCNF